MRSQIKIGDHAIESSVFLKGVGLGLAITAGVLGWMWRRKMTSSVQDHVRHYNSNGQNNNVFRRLGRRWPQAVPVK
jgi:hypothetical protein